MLLVEQIFDPVFDILRTAWFRTRKQAAFVLTNALQVGNTEQVRHLVSISCTKPLCDLLAINDACVVSAVLSSIVCLLQHGLVEQTATGREDTPYKLLIEESGGSSQAFAVFVGFHRCVDFPARYSVNLFTSGLSAGTPSIGPSAGDQCC